MSEERSAAEVRAGYIRAMGRELGELFHATSSELTWIHWRWKQYRTLFGEKQSRIDLLNKGKRQSQAVLTSFRASVVYAARRELPVSSAARFQGRSSSMRLMG